MSELFESGRTIFMESLPYLLLAGILDILGGLVLQSYLNFIDLVPGIFILIPSLMNMRNALTGIMAARLGTAFHLGTLKEKGLFKGQDFRENFIASFILAVIISVVSAMFAFYVSIFAGLSHISLAWFMIISVSSSILATAILSVITVFFMLYSIRRGIDPDNVTFPVLTTLGDIIVIMLVFVLVTSFMGVIA